MKISGVYITFLKIGRAAGVIRVILRNVLIEFYGRTPVGHAFARRAARRHKPIPAYAHSTPERIRMIIEELGPTYIKFGQILADRPDLISGRFREQLKRLQAHARPFNDLQARRIMVEELNMPLERAFRELEPVCFAAASLGQAYHATLLNGREVVVKVQRPNVEHKIQTDLYLMKYLAKKLAQNYPEMAAINITVLVNDFAESILAELDYRNEASNTQRFYEMFRDDATVYIPKVYHSFTTQRVLVMERIVGVTPESAEALREARLDPHTVAVNGANALIKMILLHGFFHADPHPGNLFVMENNVVAFIDFGMVGVLKPHDIDFLATFALGFATSNSRMVALSLMELCQIKYFDRMSELEFDLEQLIESNHGITIAEMDLARNIQRSIHLILKYNFQIPSGVFMLVKSLSTIQKVGESLDPTLSLTPLIIPHAKCVIKKKFSFQRVISSAYDTLLDYVRMIRELPNDVGEVMYKLKEGKIRHEIHIEEQQTILQTIRQLGLRIAYVLLLIGGFIGAAILLSVKKDSRLADVILYFTTTLMVILLLKWIFRRR